MVEIESKVLEKKLKCEKYKWTTNKLNKKSSLELIIQMCYVKGILQGTLTFDCKSTIPDRQ